MLSGPGLLIFGNPMLSHMGAKRSWVEDFLNKQKEREIIYITFHISFQITQHDISVLLGCASACTEIFFVK